jgi:hypothetical protein
MVSDYLGRARRAGLTWPLPDALDDAGLGALLFPPPPDVPFDQRPIRVAARCLRYAADPRAGVRKRPARVALAVAVLSSIVPPVSVDAARRR